MQFAKDIILNINCTESKTRFKLYGKQYKKIINIFEKRYFLITILVSFIILVMDYIIIKEFLELLIML